MSIREKFLEDLKEDSGFRREVLLALLSDVKMEVEFSLGSLQRCWGDSQTLDLKVEFKNERYNRHWGEWQEDILFTESCSIVLPECEHKDTGSGW